MHRHMFLLYLEFLRAPFYINDLLKNVTSTTRFLANYSLLYRRIRTTEDHRILQEDLSCLETWEIDWQISFNPLKNEVIRISKRRTQITGSYTIHGHQSPPSNPESILASPLPYRQPLVECRCRSSYKEGQ